MAAPRSPDRPIALAVAVSGEGTILEALAERAASGRFRARIVLVLADRPGIGALRRAEAAGLPTSVVGRPGPSAPGWAAEVDAELRRAGAELLLLDGFLSMIPEALVRRWPGRILNVHPSLLPRHGGRGMYGRRVHEAVLAAHDPETGVTVHEVDASVDGGPVLEQRRLPVRPDDDPESLRERLRPQEIEAIVAAVERWRRPGEG